MTNSISNHTDNSYALALDDELFLYQIEQKLNDWSKGNSIYLQDINMFSLFLQRLLITLNVTKTRISEIIPVRQVQRQNYSNAISYLQNIRTLNKNTCIDGCLKLLSLFDGTRNKIIEYQVKK